MNTRHIGPLFACCLLTACPGSSEPGGADSPDPDTETDGTGSDTGTPPVTTGQPDDDDDDDDHSTTTIGDDDDDDDDDDTGSPAVCQGANRCVAEIPDPWIGPIARRVIAAEDPLPECAGVFDETEPLAPYSGLQAEPYTCDCECEGTGIGCDGSARVRISNEQVFAGQSPCGAGNGGAGGLLSVTVTEGVPQTYDEDEVPWDSGIHGVTVDMVDIEETGSCDAVPTEVSSDASWTDRALLCGAQPVDATCDDGQVCVPDPSLPYEGGVCIYRTGAWTCPEGYPNRELYYQDFNDDRDCSQCTCGDVAGSCTGNATVGLVAFLELGSSGTLTVNAPNNFCQSVDDDDFPCVAFCTPPTSISTVTFNAGSFALDDPSSPCPPSGGEPVGDAVPIDAVSVCCTDD